MAGYADRVFDRSGTLNRPPLWRLGVEAGSLARYFVKPDRLPPPSAMPRGDGHPVLVLPAFLHADHSTTNLRKRLATLGYDVHGWDLGINFGPTKTAFDGVEDRLLTLHRETGRRVSMIGVSLGGVLAREFAKLHPDATRQVITLCSPIRTPTATHVEGIFRLVSRYHCLEVQALWERLNDPPPVPVTAVYSKIDGVVAWPSCLEVDGPHRQNIEVFACHSTIASNAEAIQIAVARLAQAEGHWRPLHPSDWASE